jgi:hypothetical protein
VSWPAPRLIEAFPFPVLNARGDVDLRNPELPYSAWEPEWQRAFAADEDATWCEGLPLGGGAVFGDVGED